MKISSIFRLVLCGLSLVAAASAWAQDKGPGRAGRAGIEGLVQQLDPSDSQREQFRAIFAESREARKAIFAKHGIEMGKGNRPDPEQMKAIQPEMAALRKETESKIQAILTEEQVAKLQELRARGNKGGKNGLKRKRKGEEEADSE
ncbi:Spy/CpxP family protein refolding chaperone [Pelagicoccus sp. NFK12]|uniref:Spy/CpxP family protein refolding chaperone n=1 Tax=Pelagicoccus enzymogenes TaxID=2773457 RepID=A0A927FB74_9BACT|nr:Spy/CpxP family protein refolding chaperone [Pelagicoccus enzymogenes]MBD5781151.1 Spy/CpxP family protein refolding chaperone [Pelagicoccus enzymogenes]